MLFICVAAGHRLLLLLPNLLWEALQCVHMGLTMEHLAMCVQIYIKIDRLDLARESLNLLKQADEDSILAQLMSAYMPLGGGAVVPMMPCIFWRDCRSNMDQA